MKYTISTDSTNGFYASQIEKLNLYKECLYKIM